MRLLLVIAVVCVAQQVRAQGPGTEATLSLIIGPPAVISVVMDAAMLTSLLPQGFASRGAAITGLILGSITGAISATCLVAGLTSRDTTNTWTIVSAVGLTAGLGSIGLSVYGLLHPPPEQIDAPLPALPRKPPPPPPPQLRVLPFFGRSLAGASLLVSL